MKRSHNQSKEAPKVGFDSAWMVTTMSPHLHEEIQFAKVLKIFWFERRS